ncbi:hypothetical protein AB0942_33155 [Streptomyces nodosus]|uniref:hypothetical protein n=1 Tax=Streptomyces nodosus TaxID=40318 RepID=UPI0034566063
MSQREINSLAKILSDPENSSRTAEEIAQLCIDELDSLRATSHRLAVVGQITQGPEEPTYTVALGPFRSPLKLTDEERFKAALERPCTAAREAGRHLAWDAKTGKGRGRFMLVPMFMKPRAAWDYFRGTGPAPVIADALSSAPKEIKPVCICGLREGVACHAHPEG